MRRDLIDDIERILDEKVRPLLGLHEGNVRIVALEDGVLQLRLLGGCSGCPSASFDAEALFEAEIMTAVRDVKEIVLIGGVSESLLDQARSLMTPR
jgi:Fe-S cluster biogenesis protein NfuA